MTLFWTTEQVLDVALGVTAVAVAPQTVNNHRRGRGGRRSRASSP
jgi:hypothetical protein